MELLGEFLRNLPEEISMVEKTSRAVEAHSNKEILFRYYSREFVMSEAARKEWIEPDLSSWKLLETK